MAFTTFENVLEHLNSLGLFHMDFALDRMQAGLEALGLATELPYVVVQTVGTNGKGSTSTFLASLGRAHGLTVGLYTSPHFITPLERIRINGKILAPEFWPELANRVIQAAPTLTYFEFLTALSLLAFQNAGVDIAIMEAGLGGHYDATTAIPAQGVCFVPIELDHQQILGPTISAIARDKAQAMRSGRPAWTAPQPPEVLAVLRETARQKNVSLHETAGMPLPNFPLGLNGCHQRSNARTALAVWVDLAAHFNWPVQTKSIAEGLRNAHLAGRFHVLNSLDKLPPLILDGAHNPHGLRALAEALHEADICPAAVIFSCLEDKAISDMLPLLARIAGNAPLLLTTIQNNERAISVERLTSHMTRMHSRPVQTMPRLDIALEALPGLIRAASREHPVLICGSLYLLGEFFTLHPAALEMFDEPPMHTDTRLPRKGEC